MVNLCTLFDSNYLDRGIVLYQSLEKCAESFCLYILCLDEISCQALDKLELKHAVVISENQILNDELARIKRERRRAEYCWTCTPVIVQYVLDHYPVDQCTYIDADMMFYSDPKVLLDELFAAGASVGIIGHRFPRNIAKHKRERYYGKYCVEFNTFLNDERGRKVLDDWKTSCLRQCTMELGEEGFGDQKYLEEWERKFDGVYEYQHPGAGVAPWNISEYRPRILDENIQLIYKKKKKCNLIFYHFQSLMIMSDKAFIGVYNELGFKSQRLINYLYREYVFKLIRARKNLRKAGVEIPAQTLRKGEKSAISKMSLTDFLIFCYQCIPCVLNGRKNFLDISNLVGEDEK